MSSGVYFSSVKEESGIREEYGKGQSRVKRKKETKKKKQSRLLQCDRLHSSHGVAKSQWAGKLAESNQLQAFSSWF